MVSWPLRTAPPGSALASSTTTSQPASASTLAATNPFWPAPMTTASGMSLAWRREDPYTQLGQLPVVDGRGRAGEGIGARLRLRERDHLADVLLAGQDRDEPVGADREPGMGRGA